MSRDRRGGDVEQRRARRRASASIARSVVEVAGLAGRASPGSRCGCGRGGRPAGRRRSAPARSSIGCPVSRSTARSACIFDGGTSVIATPSRPARPTRPMRCTYASADCGHVVVDDVREQVDVETAGGHVGGDEQLGAAAAQPLDHAGAVLLVHAAVQRLGAQAAGGEGLGDGVDVERGCGRTRSRRWAARPPAPGPARRWCACAARGTRSGAPSAPRRRAPRSRRIRTVTGSRRYFCASVSMRRGMVAENSTAWRVSGVCVEQRLDVLDEAHVEHLVGLVEHDGLELVQAQRAAVHEVDGAARGGDDDVDALLQRLPLRADGRAAVDGGDAGTATAVEAGAVAGDGLGDLQRQLTGGGEHHAEGRVAAAAASGRISAGGPASAARTPPSCRCRWRPGRAGRGPRPAGAMASAWMGLGWV